ncbi:MAG: alpha/beta hydrolase [Candidatus Kapaibacterium sp.]
MMTSIFLLLLAVTSLSLAYAAYKVHYVLPYLAIRPSRMNANDLEKRFGTVNVHELFGIRPERVLLHTRDGCALDTWIVRAEDALGTVIVLHGIASCKEMVAPRIAKYVRFGYNVVAYDSRANGASGGEFCTLGFREKLDVIDCLDEIEAKHGLCGPFAIHGSSMGGAIALQALEIEPRLRCGVVVCAFASLRETVGDYMLRLYSIRWPMVVDYIVARSEDIAGFRVDDVLPERAARGVHQPVLFVHGDKDERVNVEYGRRNYRSLASEDKELYVVEGAGHVNISEVGGALLDEKIHGWINTHLHR